MVDTPLELEPSDWLKVYAIITNFRTRGIEIHITHEYGVTFQVNDFFNNDNFKYSFYHFAHHKIEQELLKIRTTFHLH